MNDMVMKTHLGFTGLQRGRSASFFTEAFSGLRIKRTTGSVPTTSSGFMFVPEEAIVCPRSSSFFSAV